MLIVEYENETLPKKLRKKETVFIFLLNFLAQKVDLQLKKLSQDYSHLTLLYGACEECEGIGHNLNVDPKLVVSDPKKSLQDGVIEPWAKSTSLYYAQTLASIAKHYKISLSDPWKKIPKKFKI